MSELGLGCLEPSISDTAAINTVCVASPIVANAKIPNTLGVKKWLTIKNQGRRNSCGGCAMDYAAETLRLMATKFRSRADNLSARWSYCAAIDWGQTWHRGDNGVSIEAVVMAARDYGTVLEEDCPYWADNEPFDRQLPDLRGKASQHRVESVARVTTGEEVIQGLGQGIGPTVFGMHWTQGMFSYSGGVIDRDYDWRTEDVWTYLGKFRKPYNRLYDLMHKAGLSIHQQRICEPYGDEQRKGLWLYHLIEPKTWAKIIDRVAGVNAAALYSKERGNILGNQKISLPKGHTWKSYALFLLDSMPGPTAEHYRNKIARYVAYCLANYGYVGDIPDCQDGDTGAKDIPSWRRVCRCLLRNDYWCYSLSFSATKTAAYEKYTQLMLKRRRQWGLFG